MRRRVWIPALAFGVALLAVPVLAAAPRAATPPVTSLLLQPGEMPGFVPGGKPIVASTAERWARLEHAGSPAQIKKGAATLRSEGFLAGAMLPLKPTRAGSKAQAISVVLEFGSAAGARKELARSLAESITAQGKGARIRRFTIAAVPGSKGFTATAAGQPGGAANVLFTSGGCFVLIGDALEGGNLAAPVTAAATTLYRRIRNTCS